jgi:hypothetical protein
MTVAIHQAKNWQINEHETLSSHKILRHFVFTFKTNHENAIHINSLRGLSYSTDQRIQAKHHKIPQKTQFLGAEK